MIGNRLRRAREASGLSLRELEAVIGSQVSAQAIGKYERDEMMPGSSVLLSLSKALRVTPEYLLSTDVIELTGIDFRKAPQATVKEEKSVEAAVIGHVERYLQLEELVSPEGRTWICPDSADFQILAIEEAERAADTLRRIWSLGIDPIPVMAELLESRGIKVIALELSETVSGSKAWVDRTGHDGLPVIVVNAKHNGERQRFTLAHELAHLVLRCTNLSDAEQEKAADRFAGAFLIAKEMFLSVLGANRTSISLGELAELKKFFKVSIACLVTRCTQLGVLSKAAAGRLWALIATRGWNKPGSSEPNSIEAEVPNRMERLCLRAVAEAIISESKGAELLNITTRALEKKLMGVPA